MFAKTPGINGPAWTPHMVKAFKKVYPHEHEASPWQNYLCLEIDGTVPSGHPAKTTLGNTLRSILYARFYMNR